MIDTNKIEKQPPVLKAKDIAPGRVTVLTVADVDQKEFPDGTKVRIVFEEFPGHTYFPNITSLRNLVDALGADETKWSGKQVVLEVVKTNDPRTNKPVESLWVASADTWSDHMDQFNRRAARKTATPAAAKRGDEHIPAASARKKTARRR